MPHGERDRNVMMDQFLRMHSPPDVMMNPDCMMGHAPRYVTWKYPEQIPTMPFVMVYHPCACGHIVNVEAVPVTGYLAQLPICRQEQMRYAEQILAPNWANGNFIPRNQEYVFEDGNYNDYDDFNDDTESGEESDSSENNLQINRHNWFNGIPHVPLERNMIGGDFRNEENTTTFDAETEVER